MGFINDKITQAQRIQTNVKNTLAVIENNGDVLIGNETSDDLPTLITENVPEILKGFPNGKEWALYGMEESAYDIKQYDGGMLRAGDYYSTDGKTWTKLNLPCYNDEDTLVTYGNGIWLNSDKYYMYYSYDNGDTWEQNDEVGAADTLIFANGYFFAYEKNYSPLYYSEDCSSWNLIEFSTDYTVKNICYSNKMIICVVMEDGYNNIYSYDPRYGNDIDSWEYCFANNYNFGSDINLNYCNGIFYSIADSCIVYSYDSYFFGAASVMAWETISDTILNITSSDSNYYILNNNGIWVATCQKIDDTPSICKYSYDFNSWTSSNNAPHIIFKLLCAGNKFFIIGADFNDDTLYRENHKLYYSDNGIDWNDTGIPSEKIVGDIDIDTINIIYGNGIYLSNIGYYSIDGINWISCESIINFKDILICNNSTDARWIAVDNDGNMYYSKIWELPLKENIVVDSNNQILVDDSNTTLIANHINL